MIVIYLFINLFVSLLVGVFFSTFFKNIFVRGVLWFINVNSLFVIILFTIDYYKTETLFFVSKVLPIGVFSFLEFRLLCIFIFCSSLTLLYGKDKGGTKLIEGFIANRFNCQQMLFCIVFILWLTTAPKGAAAYLSGGVCVSLVVRYSLNRFWIWFIKTDLVYILFLYIILFFIVVFFSQTMFIISSLFFLAYVSFLFFQTIEVPEKSRGLYIAIKKDCTTLQHHFMFEFSFFWWLSLQLGQLGLLNFVCLFLKQTACFGFEKEMPIFFLDTLSTFSQTVLTLAPLLVFILSVIKLTIVLFCNPKMDLKEFYLSGFVMVAGLGINYVNNKINPIPPVLLDVEAEHSVSLLKKTELEKGLNCRIPTITDLPVVTRHREIIGGQLPILQEPSLVNGVLSTNCVDISRAKRETELVLWYQDQFSRHQKYFPASTNKPLSTEAILYTYGEDQSKSPSNKALASYLAKNKDDYFLVNPKKDGEVLKKFNEEDSPGKDSYPSLQNDPHMQKLVAKAIRDSIATGKK